MRKKSIRFPVELAVSVAGGAIISGAVIIGAVMTSSSRAADEPVTPEDTARYQALDAKSLYQLTNPELADYLDLRTRLGVDVQEQWTPAEKIGLWAAKSVGQPYLLGAYSLDLKEGDCVSATEKWLALALSEDWDAYYKLVHRLRYRDGVVDVLEKNFFPLADWVPSNDWLLVDVTDQLGVATETFQVGVARRAFLEKTRYGDGAQPGYREHAIQIGAFGELGNAVAVVDVMGEAGFNAVIEQQPRGARLLHIVLIHYPSHADAVTALPAVRNVQSNARLTQASLATAKTDRLAVVPEKEIITERCVPRAGIPAILDYLETGDIFMIVRLRSKPGQKPFLYCDHQGVIVRIETGEIDIIHSAPPQIRREPLLDLVDRYRFIAGLKILRLRSDALQAASQEIQTMATKVDVRTPEQEDQRLDHLRAVRAASTGN